MTIDNDRCSRADPARARRGLLGAAAAGLAAAAAALPSSAPAAEPFPSQPIRIVVPFSAGSPPDAVARLIGAKLAEGVGQQVVVDNRPGASGNIGSEAVAKALPDGHTLLLTGSLITLLPSTLGAVAVDPVASFAPVTKIGEAPLVVVAHPSLPANSLQELMELARREPGKFAYATPGVGTVHHLTASVILRKAGVEMVHVPYNVTGRAIADVVSGQVPVYFTAFGPINGPLRSGQVKAVAVGSERRVPAWPDVPTVAEAGFGEATVAPWNGVLAPAGTPPAIVERLHRELARIMEQPEVRERLSTMGIVPMATPPDRFAAEIREAVLRWPPIVKAAGVRLE